MSYCFLSESQSHEKKVDHGDEECRVTGMVLCAEESDIENKYEWIQLRRHKIDIIVSPLVVSLLEHLAKSICRVKEWLKRIKKVYGLA